MFEVFNCQILTIKCIADLDYDVQIVFWMVDVTEQILISPSSAKKVSFFFSSFLDSLENVDFQYRL